MSGSPSWPWASLAVRTSMRSTRPPGAASPVWPPVSHVHGPAVTVPVPAVMARLRRFSPAAAQPASAGGAPPASQARGRAAAAARLRVPGGRHRRRRSRDDAAACPPGPGMTGPPAMPGWDADQAVDVLYHAHYRALTRLAALLVTDVAAAEEMVQAAFAAMHGAGSTCGTARRPWPSCCGKWSSAHDPTMQPARPCPAASRACPRPCSQLSPPRKPSWQRFRPFQPGSARPWCSGITRACQTPRSPLHWGPAHAR